MYVSELAEALNNIIEETCLLRDNVMNDDYDDELVNLRFTNIENAVRDLSFALECGPVLGNPAPPADEVHTLDDPPQWMHGAEPSGRLQYNRATYRRLSEDSNDDEDEEGWGPDPVDTMEQEAEQATADIEEEMDIVGREELSEVDINTIINQATTELYRPRIPRTDHDLSPSEVPSDESAQSF